VRYALFLDGKEGAGPVFVLLVLKILHFRSTRENMPAWSPMVSEDPKKRMPPGFNE
jgi:hypothetical protein